MVEDRITICGCDSLFFAHLRAVVNTKCSGVTDVCAPTLIVVIMIGHDY
jgi:hypothetical protein